MSAGFVIRYDYAGTTNGKPVGLVYATGPHFGIDVWSHTYDPAEAAVFGTRDEAEAAVSRYWRNALVMPLAEARVLGGAS